MNEQILREQVIELTKLLELKDMRIKELEALRTIPTVISQWANSLPSSIILTDLPHDKASCICCNRSK